MENLLNKRQVAELLQISAKTLDLWAQKSQGPKSIRIGRLVRFKKSDVAAFIEMLSTEGK